MGSVAVASHRVPLLEPAQAGLQLGCRGLRHQAAQHLLPSALAKHLGMTAPGALPLRSAQTRTSAARSDTWLQVLSAQRGSCTGQQRAAHLLHDAQQVARPLHVESQLGGPQQVASLCVHTTGCEAAAKSDSQAQGPQRACLGCSPRAQQLQAWL